MSTALAVQKPKKKKANRVVFWSAECKYVVILDRVNELEWKLVDDDKLLSKVNLLWIDVATIHERIHGIKPWQCINHFPGMPNIARKNRMGQNLNRMLKIFPKEYSFYPRTWILPGELADFRTNFDSNGNSIGNKIYIIKPDAGCQGRGIFLTRTWDTVPMMENVVAQLYIKKPLLIDGFKFDLRLYCLVSSVKPFRMYLFHDGLVRMCTEEYVKPTKQNINNVCMHLTNYAVNKHNENFHQPSAKSSEENQDEGSKRSLHWFMNSVRKDKGDAKADWLWKRMGTLCTRTVMSILPTLSREYESKFKDFKDIPVDISKIISTNGYAGSSPTAAASTGVASAATTPTATAGPTKAAVAATGKPPMGLSAKLKSATAANKDENDGTAAAGGGSEDERGASPADAFKSSEDGNGNANGGGESTEVPDGMPKMRGSRCFEILGFDIMLDSNLKPWLIEVNHLPSFGTDSLLDKDIKERLMEQVFSVLPVMADDERAAQAYHKVESEKRLIAQRVQLKAEEEAKHKRPSMPTRKKESGGSGSGVSLPQVRDSSDGSEPQPQPSLFNNAETGVTARSPTPPADPAPSSTAAATAAASAAGGDTPPPAEVEDEECTPERLEEIKSILGEVYKKYSPEKMGKIDRLLAKYFGHEEEFLRFVFAKYEVDPAQYDPRKRRVIPPPVNVSSDGTQAADGKERASSLTPKGRGASNNNREVSKRYSRSLSPPRSGNMASGSAKNKSSNWKSTTDEDAAYRTEVLAAHIPDENDEWMQYELSKLVQFTRIFPPVASSKDGNEEGNEEDEDDGGGNDDDDNANTTTASAASANGGATAATSSGADKENANKNIQKVTPIEEILFQIFVQDKRQTMRLRCPLPSRVKMDDNASSFLPEIESKSSRTNSISTSTSAKGVGWKAPPKPVSKEPPRQPTESQLAAAQRLSQGLTVNSSRSARMRNSNALGANGYSVVLDGSADYNGNPIEQQEHQPFTLGMSTKASRLLEERNMNKIRLEQAKANQAAVLRQQVFHFDPNYDPFAGAGGPQMGGGIGGNSIVGGGGAGPGGGNYSDNASVMGGGGSVVGGGSVAMDGRPAPPNSGYRGGSNGRANSYNAGEPSYLTQQQQQLQMQQMQQQHAMNGGTQEELLKQLFPSWF